jgi:predicted  nucleic acid-binding Zn-ribbon protein
MPVDLKVRYAFRNVVLTLEDIQEKLAGDGLTIVNNDVLWLARRARELEARAGEQILKSAGWEITAKAAKAHAKALVSRLRTAHERIEQMQEEVLQDLDESTRLRTDLEAAEARIRKLEAELTQRKATVTS